MQLEQIYKYKTIHEIPTVVTIQKILVFLHSVKISCAARSIIANGFANPSQ